MNPKLAAALFSYARSQATQAMACATHLEGREAAACLERLALTMDFLAHTTQVDNGASLPTPTGPTLLGFQPTQYPKA